MRRAAFPGPEGEALVHLHNLSGGVLGGDRLELEVRVGPGARAQLTTTGATRVYRRGAGAGEAVQLNRLRVEQDGLLEYLPDPLIPYRGASYRQSTGIELAPGGGLFWWETLTPGREAHGERFDFERVVLETEIRSGQDRVPIARERAVLEPSRRSLTSPARMGLYGYLVTFYICRAGDPAGAWLSLEQELGRCAGNGRGRAR